MYAGVDLFSEGKTVVRKFGVNIAFPKISAINGDTNVHYK